MTPDAQRLYDIRTQLGAISPGRWSLVADDQGEFVEAAGPMGERLPIARVHPGATMQEKMFLADAPDMVAFLLALVDRAIASARNAAVAEPAKAGPNHAAEAAMKCAEPAFKAFLEACHELERPLTDERCAQKVRTLCGVSSRRALNDDSRAASAWRDLRKQFDDWKKRDRR